MDNKNHRKEDLSLTMQQKFDFDSNKLYEENTMIRKVKNNRSKSEINRKIKAIIKIKNKYKKKYRIFLSLFIIMIFICLGMLFVYFNTEQEKPKVEKQIVEKTIVPENIVFLGDSITDYYDLEKYYDDKINLVNSGISGNTTEDILKNMKNRVYNYNPSKIFILIGVNDINFNISKEKVVYNIKKMVKEIQKNRPYCKIYLESIYPINNGDFEKINHEMVGKRTNELIKEINKELKEFSKEENIIYIDIYSLLEDENGNLDLDYTTEGLHISESGYEIITNKLKKYL